MEFKSILKYDFLETMKVGEVQAWPNINDRHSIRATAMQRYGYSLSVKRKLDAETGAKVLRIERTK